LRALCSSRSLGAPCGTFVCRESELKTFSGDQIPLLDSRCLVFLPAAHLAGIALKGFGPEPVPWAVLVGVPWAVLVGAPRPRLGRSLGSPCRHTSSAPRAFPGQSLSAHLFRVSGVPWAVLVGAPRPPLGRSLGAPCGFPMGAPWAIRLLGKRAKNVKWRQICLLGSHCLVFWLVTHPVGMALTGFAFGPFLGRPSCVLLVGPPSAPLVGPPGGFSLGAPCGFS
jgi:hypothetical protein